MKMTARNTTNSNLYTELATWAASKPKIRALYVTGGCARSGLDVAVELEDQRSAAVAALWRSADMCAELATLGIRVASARLSTWLSAGEPAMLIYAKMPRLAKAADAVEGSRAFLEKRAPVFTGR